MSIDTKSSDVKSSDTKSSNLSKLKEFFLLDKFKEFESNYIETILSGKNEFANWIQGLMVDMLNRQLGYLKIKRIFNYYPSDLEFDILVRLFKEMGSEIGFGVNKHKSQYEITCIISYKAEDRLKIPCIS